MKVLQGLLMKKVAEIVIKSIVKKHKLNKLQKYVEQENELDKQMVHLQRKVNKQGMYIEELEKDVASLSRDSHKPIKNLEERIKKLEKKD